MAGLQHWIRSGATGTESKIQRGAKLPTILRWNCAGRQVNFREEAVAIRVVVPAGRRGLPSCPEPGMSFGSGYSVRNARTGSMEAARRAGMMLATRAQSKSVAMEAMRTTGSHPLTW